MELTKEWLEKRYVADLAPVENIADEAGYSVHNIRRWLRIWKIRRGDAFKSTMPAWNKGLTKETDERLARLSEQRTGEGNPMHGRPAWNTGLSKETDERVASSAEKRIGMMFSDEARAKMSAAKLGLRGENANRFKGGVSRNNGYAVTLVDGEYEYTHRFVAKTILGRELEESECVHHFDRIKVHNSPDNLVVISNADHTRLHSADPGDKTAQIAWLKSKGIKFILLEKA